LAKLSLDVFEDVGILVDGNQEGESHQGPTYPTKMARAGYADGGPEPPAEGSSR
jgi:hypothetical protein